MAEFTPEESKITPFRASERNQAAELRTAASAVIERMQFARMAGLTFGGMRDNYGILGYERVLTIKEYRDRYARGGIAGRIVDAYPNATWRGDMWIEEDENPKVSTPFEKAWDDLEIRLKLQAVLRRADILSGLSYYSCILIGAPGNFDEELQQGKPEQLLYLTPFSGGGGPGARAGGFNSRDVGAGSSVAFGDATIGSFDTDIQSPRFGLPLTYQFHRIDVTSPALQRPVHWSRVCHIAEGTLDNEVYGSPRLERVWNLIDDLDKCTGGGAEAFWLKANVGIHLNIDRDMVLSDPEKAELKNQADEYQHQLRRMIRTRGVEVHELGGAPASFNSEADAILTQIAGALAIPKRILTGSEMGELASSQDRDNWKDQINGRQTGYVGPYIVRPLVDRLIKYGYLPTPVKGPLAYAVKWPHIETLTEQEKSEGASKWAAVNRTVGQTVFTIDEIRDKWYGLEPVAIDDDEEYKAILAQKMALTNQTQGAVIFTDEEIRKTSYGWAPLTPEQKAAAAAPPAPEAPPEVPVPEVPAPVAPETPVKKPNAFPRAAEEHAFSSTQLDLPADITEQILEFGESILDDQLAVDGREAHPHVTVKYGLHTESADLVARILDGEPPVEIIFGKTGVFSAPDHDVLYVEVQSLGLRRLNVLLSTELDVTDTHPVYQPHVTIAYLQSGLGEQYEGRDDFVGQRVTVDGVTFSSSEGSSMMIPLTTSADIEMIKVLEAAIVAGNTDVIDRIVGMRHAGDVPGHEFHGNQWTGGKGAADTFDAIAAGRSANVSHTELRDVLKLARKDDRVVDLTKLTVDDTKLFAGGLNERRNTMPQIKEHQETFFKELKDAGITTKREDVRPASLLPVQNEINAGKVGKMVKKYEKGERRDTPIMISQDNYVLDGHHGWAAMATIDITDPTDIFMPVIRINKGHADALKFMRDFMTRHGIKYEALVARALGDLPGHEFHGNQWTSALGKPASAYTPMYPEGRDTKSRFSDGHGNYTPDRAALHDAITEKYMAGTTAVDYPTSTILGGGMGSGKTTLVNAEGIGKENTVLVNVDDIRNDLPEYRSEGGKRPPSTAETHEEASDISKLLTQRSIDAKRNIVLDGTGDSTLGKLGGKVAVMRSGGHAINAEYVTTSVEEAQRRADIRGEKIGRFVPPTAMREAHRSVSQIFPEAIRQGLFDKSRLFDTTERRPRLVASSKGTDLVIHDQALWNDFLAKGK